MFRPVRLILALALLLVAPTLAEAQRDTRYTREATRYIGLALLRQDRAQQEELYRQAMVPLREGMERDAENAKIWLLAGQVYAALGQMQEADRAFVRAVEMYPAYAEEVVAERESAWIRAFNQGLELMDAQRYDEAIVTMEAAQVIYNQRPEALMNLGALYANAGNVPKAMESFEKAVEATRGPLFEQVDEETRNLWIRYRAMANVNVAQMVAAQGVEHFNGNRFPDAEAAFRRAAELNPQSRDYWFNYLQAVWAQVNEHEDALETAGEAAARAREALPALYARGIEIVEKTRAFDPTNEILFRIEAQARRMMGELGGTDQSREQGQQAAYAVLVRMDAQQITLDNVVAYTEGEGVRIEGEIKNRKATEGSTVTIEFTILDIDGSAIGTTTITVNAPAVESTAQFSGLATTEGDFAGWRYAIR
jgi:tetratricopeptide (TPR) repeat protein